ncbi:MAG: DegT/DnrJ/EryC1/StrS family aminotransferase [Alphaproteobacteria bacterium]|nr:DegT/DnrJ/EryC1/StrS family aminotransferase [Alphaproteobacteria bacterium]
MLNKPEKAIPLFDCKTTQQVIGQQKFLDAFKTILDHGGYCQGPETRELDTALANYSGTKFCATCGSGTDALTLALMAWGVGAGDAVFVSSFTFVASAECVAIVGATPIFVDSDPNTFNMDINDLERAIAEVKKEGKLTPKVIIPVDIFGSPCDYDAIMSIAAKNNLKVLSDSCQSYGSVYKGKKAGSIADMTATSFYPTKPLGGYGDGGATFTNSEEENELLKSCRVHGMSATDHYDNIRLGMTGRMNTFQAAVLLQKLTVFDAELKARAEVAARYDAELDNYFGKQHILPNCKSAYALYTIHCEDRDELMAYLKEKGIPCGAYYPRPVNTQTAYAKWNTRPMPVCEKLSKTVLSIPMTPYLDKEQLDYVIGCMNEFASQKKSKAA